MRSITILFISLVACGGGDPLEDPDHVAGWANSASALGVFTHAYEPLAIADGEVSPEDSACPVIADDGSTVEITGDGCSDAEGGQWHGSATITAGATRTVTLSEFGHARDPDLTTRATGSIEVSELGADLHQYIARIEIRGGVDTDIDYTGTVSGTYGSGPTVWNGSGTVRRDALSIHSGTIEAETRDQLRDGSICAGQGISGETVMVSDDHTVVITYDGATDCDDDDSAQWSLDGVDQGALAGVVCSAGGSPGPAAALLVFAVLLGFRRRRRS